MQGVHPQRNRPQSLNLRQVFFAFRWVGYVFLILIFAFPVSLWAESNTPARPEAVVRLMVEFQSERGARRLSFSDDLAVSIRKVDRLSNHAPLAYSEGGVSLRAKDLRRWRVIEVAASGAQTLQEELEQNPAVASVREEHVYEAAIIPSDARFSEQIGLHTEAWPLDINAPEAWERTTGSGNTVIAIVDGGVDTLHEDLKDKIWNNPGEIAGNGQDDDGNGFVDDVHGWDFVANRPAVLGIDHGTHVAGIAAASSNNGVGVAGVDWGARIMSVRVLGSGGFGGESNIIEGINYAVASGADVINLSIAGPSSQALIDAVENAYASGVVVVAAAGNSGVNTDRVRVMPGCADVNGVNMVLGVGAIDEEGEPASFSNYGTCVDVSAPGKDILSTKVGDRYGTMKGTSMSSPFVAGVAGLYLSLHPNAGPAEVISAITSNMTAFVGADAVEWNADYKGRLNAAAVVGGSAGDSNGGSSQPAPTPAPSSGGSASASEGGGGGGGDSGGGGGGGGGSSSASGEATADEGRRPQVAGIKKVAISAADRKAPDFIQNHTVPAAAARLFQRAWGRAITHTESLYWKTRARSDKPTESKLYGAILWQKLRGFSFDPRFAPAKVAGAQDSMLAARIRPLFQQVYGRGPTPSEYNYWLSRVKRGEKKTEAELVGAMLWHFHRTAAL